MAPIEDMALQQDWSTSQSALDESVRANLMRDRAKLLMKLAEVMAEVKQIPKAGKNPSQHYNYATVMDMIEEVRPKLAARKLVLIGDVTNADYSEATTSKGGVMTVVHLMVQWTVYDGETGASLSFATIGEASDTSDKATNKAHTAAQKLAISKLVMLSTGDDPEAAEDVERAPRQQRTGQGQDSPTWPAGGGDSYGTCPRHEGVEFFKTAKMRAPAHKLDDGSWCNYDEVLIAEQRAATAALNELHPEDRNARADFVQKVPGIGNKTPKDLTPEEWHRVGTAAAEVALDQQQVTDLPWLSDEPEAAELDGMPSAQGAPH